MGCEISKPITLVREDFISNLSNAINESQLPAFIVESILKDFLNEVHIASQRQLEADRAKYQEMIAKEGKDK